MASISTDSDGKRRILFVDPDGEGRQIRLGKVPMKTAATIKARVENLLAAAIGRPRDRRRHGRMGGRP